MTLYVIGFILVFLLIFFSGLPIGFGLGILGLGILTAYAGPSTALSVGIEKAYAALNTDVLVAIPLFVFTAQLISATGMGKRLFDAAKAFMGGYRSGLGAATIVSSGVFAAMTGSSTVSAVTMGLIVIPELRKAKYSDTLISAAIASGGSLGAVIPPSLVLIIYGFLTNESIGKLFMAGVIPGIILIILYCIAIDLMFRYSKRTDTSEPVTTPAAAAAVQEQPQEEPQMSRLEALKQAFWGLLAPVIIIGGLYIGIFTANEAAAIAVLYCIFIGFFVYKSLTLKSFWDVVMSSTSFTSLVALIIIGGAMLSQGCVFGRIPQQILEFIIAKNMHPYLLFTLVLLFLFILGMFMESVSLMYLAIPLLYPVVLHMQWDNIWFSMMLLINVNLGLITPPMGGILYVIAQIGGIPFETAVKGALMPIIVLIITMLLIIIFPPIATWLPSLM